MKHKLDNIQLIQAMNVASQKEITIPSAILLLRFYVFDRKGVAISGIDPYPIDKFEKAVTIASNYFNLVNKHDFNNTGTWVEFTYNYEGDEDINDSEDDGV